MKNDINYVVLVDENDIVIGKMEKMEAHKKALLHRAISVFICNSKGEWLLHRRAMEKYHSKGLWTNTSCSHPFPKEKSLDAAKRRLYEEMGLNAELTEIHSFIYKQELEDNLTEYEFDHVFVGTTDEIPNINLEEVMDYKYLDFQELKTDINNFPAKYTVWFKLIVNEVGEIINDLDRFNKNIAV